MILQNSLHSPLLAKTAHLIHHLMHAQYKTTFFQ